MFDVWTGVRRSKSNVRVSSATNRDLRSEVNAGSFRLDLFFRLAVVIVDVPPLRERAEDIPLLIQHFLSELGAESDFPKLFPPERISELKRHRWPGNIRELKNLVASTRALGPDASPSLGFSPNAGSKCAASDVVEGVLELEFKAAKSAVLDDFEQRYRARLIARAHGNVCQAAREAKLDRNYLADLLKRHKRVKMDSRVSRRASSSLCP